MRPGDVGVGTQAHPNTPSERSEGRAKEEAMSIVSTPHVSPVARPADLAGAGLCSLPSDDDGVSPSSVTVLRTPQPASVEDMLFPASRARRAALSSSASLLPAAAATTGRQQQPQPQPSSTSFPSLQRPAGRQFSQQPLHPIAQQIDELFPPPSTAACSVSGAAEGSPGPATPPRQASTSAGGLSGGSRWALSPSPPDAAGGGAASTSDHVTTIVPCKDRIRELAVDARVKACQQRIAEQHVRALELEAAALSHEQRLKEARAAGAAETQRRRELEEALRQCKELLDGKGAWYVQQRSELAQAGDELRARLDRQEAEAVRSRTELTLRVAELEAQGRGLEAAGARDGRAAEQARGEAAALERRLREKGDANKALIRALNVAEARAGRDAAATRRHHEARVAALEEDAELKAAVVEQLRDGAGAAAAEAARLRATLAGVDDAHASALGALREELSAARATAAALEKGEEACQARVESAERLGDTRVREKERLLHAQNAAVKTMELQWDEMRRQRDALAREVTGLREEAAEREKAAAEVREEGRAAETLLEGRLQELQEALVGAEQQRAVEAETIKKRMFRQAEEVRRLEDELETHLQLIPQANLCDADAERVRAREAALRAALSHALSDVVYLNSVMAATTPPTLCNTETDEERAARAAGVATAALAARLQAALGELTGQVQAVLIRRAQTQTLRVKASQGWSPGMSATASVTNQDDCAVQ